MADSANDTGIKSGTIVVGTSALTRTAYVQGWGRWNSGNPFTLRVFDIPGSIWLTPNTPAYKFEQLPKPAPGGTAPIAWQARGGAFTIQGTCGTVRVHCHIGSADNTVGGTAQFDAFYLNLPGSVDGFSIYPSIIIYEFG